MIVAALLTVCGRRYSRRLCAQRSLLAVLGTSRSNVSFRRTRRRSPQRSSCQRTSTSVVKGKVYGKTLVSIGIISFSLCWAEVLKDAPLARSFSMAAARFTGSAPDATRRMSHMWTMVYCNYASRRAMICSIRSSAFSPRVSNPRRPRSRARSIRLIVRDA